MTDTQKYIQAYKAALPRLREKVAAAVIMLVISAIMATSATFAWVSLSVNPEVSNIQTTVTANGNLEIALSDVDGLEPEKSQVGDSGKDLVVKNVTWGNLVNLSDPLYGLGKLTLRPAELNTTGDLLTAPLKVVTYGKDGRVDKFSSSLLYTKYDEASGEYLVPDDDGFGVKIISAVEYKNATGANDYQNMLAEAETNWSAANSIYQGLISNQNNLDALSGLIGAFVDNKLNGGSPDVSVYVPKLYSMMMEFQNFVDATDGVLCNLAVIHQYPHMAEEEIIYHDIEELLAATDAEREARHVKIDGLATYKSDRTKLKQYIAELKAFSDKVTVNGGTVTWQEISHIMNFMVDIPSTTINGIAAKDVGMSEAAGMLLGTQKAVIHKGAIYNMEKMSGSRMYVPKVSISATVKGMSASVKASVETSVTEPYYIKEAVNDARDYGGDFAGGDAVATDTYGLAMDLWLRTNATNAYLVLEGSPIIEQVEQVDEDGNVVTDENDEPIMIGAVTGYDGANRIWNDGASGPNSTTQGNGSCYIFYADDPIIQQKALEVMGAMKVAFVDAAGRAIAYADMDVAHAYQETGKITIPLVLNGRSTEILDAEGNPVKDLVTGESYYAVKKLEKNTAERITAILYIDGTKVTNTDVLADADIQGQLNLQFGINEQMAPADDEDLKFEEVLITGELSKDEFDFDTETDFSTLVTLTVDGIEPERVTANFIRAINETQGTREKEITFEMQSNNIKWTSTMDFDAPGNYILRSVFLDGVEYDLEEPLVATVKGYGIKSLSCDKVFGSTSATYMTADNYLDASYTLVMASSARKPAKIQGVLSNEHGQQIITDFKAGTDFYKANVRFETSGTYKMTHLIIDGEWYEVPAAVTKVLHLYLGMTTKVMLSETDFILEEPRTVEVYAEVYNDKDEEMEGLTGTKIRFSHKTNSLTVLDSDMTWNEDTGRYEGNFLVQRAGVYNFAFFRAGDSTIRQATAPSIRASSPEPPKYVGLAVEEFQFRPGNDAALGVQISNSETLAEAVYNAETGELVTPGDLVATIRYRGVDNTVTNGTEIQVYGESVSTVGDVTTWHFTPYGTAADGTKITPDGTQQGYWELVDVTMTYLGINENFEEEQITEKYIIAEVIKAGETAVTQVSTDISKNVQATITGTSQNFTGTMLADHYVTDLGVTITDIKGNPVKGITDVKFTYNYTPDRSVFNTGSSLPGEGETRTVATEKIKTGTAEDGTDILSETQYQMVYDDLANTSDMNLLYCGTYTTGIQFTMNGVTYTGTTGTPTASQIQIKGTVPTYTVSWTRPDIKITATHSGSTNTATGTSFKSKPIVSLRTKNVTNTVAANGKSASIYFEAISAGWLYDYYPTKVTIQLSGAGNFTTATMSSDGITYTFTPKALSQQVAIGSIGNGYYSSKNPTFSSIVFNDADGRAFTLTLTEAEKITITTKDP